MFLRDFILRRKSNGSEGASRTVAVMASTPVDDLALQTLIDPAAIVEDRMTVLRLEPCLQAAEPETANAAGRGAELGAGSGSVVVPITSGVRRHGAVMQRITALKLPADAGAGRQDAILERLSIVHDPNEVVLTGFDRTARIFMANRRLMSARFSLPGRVDEVFSFNRRRVSKRAGQDLLASLAGFCAGAVDLTVTERSMSGVFDALAGLAVSDLLAGADAAVQHEDEMDLQSVAG